jgi:ADP-heptose:LPS heptosyltransferase
MFIVKNRNLFRINRILLLYLPWLSRIFSKLRKPKKRLLIIKTDAIGDYILFRNFIEVVKCSSLYSDYKIDLLGNILWKDIALTYDSSFVNDFTFINADNLYDDPVKTFKIGWKLFKNNYAVVLQPTYSRTLINDGLAALTGTANIIGWLSDNERMPERYKKKTDRFYRQLIALPAEINYEFNRNCHFFEQIIHEPIKITGPQLPVNKTAERGVVIFPGAGSSKRRWEPQQFIKLIKLILQQTTQPIYLAGGPSESQTNEFIERAFPAQSIINLTGKTTLPQLVNLIASAALLIANETSAIHIAAATNTPSICILGGGHFGRFAPYPDVALIRPNCVYHQLECYHCNWNCIFKTTEDEPHPCISIISVENVWKITKELLPL